MKQIAQMAAMVIMLVLFGTSSWAVDKKYAVDANTEADWASDKLYRATGTCANPANFITVDTSPKTTGGAPVIFDDVNVPDGTYCYKATAIDTAGNESPFSNTLGVTVNANPPAAPANLRETQ